MKKLITLLMLLVVCSNVCAQNRLFVRLYDLNDKKINKGFILAVNDTILRLKKDTTYVDIPVKTIGTIRTKRTVGNNILIGTLVGSTLFATIGAATADPDSWFLDYTPAEGAIIGTLIGAPAGAIVGTFSCAFKNSKKFVINGDAEKWKAFLLHFSEKTGGGEK